MHIFYDPDEYEQVVESGGTPPWTGYLSVTQRRRSPEEIAGIKAAKKRAEEDDILRRADAIRAARASEAR